tara:strand:+ start:15434 stop:20665 length:5232 start_codon:yes stop_codon:yes gene_type:complete
MALGDKLNRKVRGLSTDKAYTDSVIENNGAVIVSGGTPSDNALINSGEAIGTVTTTRSGERVAEVGPNTNQTGFLDSSGNMTTNIEIVDQKPLIEELTYEAPSNTIQVNIKSTPIGGTVIVDGRDTKTLTNKPMIFGGKELLTPRIIEVQKGKAKSTDKYKIYTVKQNIIKNVKPVLPLEVFEPIPIDETFNIERRGFGGDYLGFEKAQPLPIPQRPLTVGRVGFSYYQLRVEKNGKEINVNNQINDITGTINKGFSVDLTFKLKDEIVIDPPTPKVYSIEIESNMVDGDIKYITSWGEEGLLEDEGLITLSKKPNLSKEQCYVDFKPNNISNLTHTVSYDIQTPTTKSINTIKALETRVILSPGNTKVEVNSVKIPKEEINKPTLNVEIDNLKFNILSDEDTKIVYNTQNTDEVVYTLGKTSRTLKPNGTIILNKNDFYNGVGNYVIYLQPNSSKAGSGDVKRININVVSKEYLPGPDITHINYPQNIVGADFKGFDVPFDVSWQSINTNFVYVYAGKYSKDTRSNFLGQFEPNGKAKFKVSDVLKASGINITENSDVVQFSLNLVPFNIEGNERTEGKIEVINITFDKGDLTLRREIVINDIKESFRKQFDKKIFEDVSPFLTHYLHLGGGNNKLIATWDIDKNTLSTFKFDEETNENKKVEEVKALVLKLYEPLPQDINLNHKTWISKIQSIPIIDTITLVDGETAQCTPLTPNFNLDVGDDIGYQILDDLIASGSTTSTDVVNEFISSSEFDLSKLDISYVTSSTTLVETDKGTIKQDTGVHDYNWAGFVKYSSAEERSANFLYKVQLIESYENKILSLDSGSATTSSVAIQNERERTVTKINNVKKGFDSFEKFLYTSSSLNDLTYPGAGQNTLSASSDSTVTDWYSGLQSSARTYDYDNKSRFVNNLPQHIQDDFKGEEFTLFFDMVGQHFDNIWAHIEGISKSKKTENKYDVGIVNDLVYHMLESLGWDADMGVKSQLLWEYAFGKHSDGTVVANMSGKDRQSEIWRRILNNLPYLNKHKGTKRALHAALSIYGIPQSLLTVMEFGGPKDPSKEGTTKFSFEDRTAAISLVSGSFISIPWKKYNSSFSNEYPNSVELTVNTDQKQDQQIISASNWSVDIINTSTGSLGQIQLTVGAQSASTNPMPIFNDEYTQIVVNRVSGSTTDEFEIFVKEAFQGRIRNSVSASLSATTKAWTSGSEFHVGQTLTGSVDEIRLWRTALDENKIDNHTLLPDAIDGNHISASTTDLIFRNDFEYPKNRGTDVEIKNVALTTSYATFSTASNFENISDYPYNYIPYDRDVTADVPASGFNVGNKIRFETQTVISDLTYRSRATKKSFDNAPIDSNRLGLFFSPIKEINMDILKSLGGFDIGNYIGNPADDFSPEYGELKTLRNYYFDRYSLNINEYIQLVRYIDKSLFDVLESLAPARAKVSSGLLIEPHILERSKIEQKPTVATKHNYQSKIDTQEDIEINFSNKGIEGFVTASQEISLAGTKDNYVTIVTASDNHVLSGDKIDYLGIITQSDDVVTTGEITTNSGSNMGGISITVDASFTGSVQGQFDSTAYQQIGMGPESLTQAGFGLYGINGTAIRTRLDKSNNFVKERVKVYLLKEQFTEDVPQNIDENDSSLGTELVSTTKHRFKVNILPFTGSDGNETSSSVAGNIVEVTALDGYFPTHYVNVGDLTSGMENSFFKGSKQTSATTLDGGSPVQTFTTNPNTLRVSDAGRGSGEPILEVD